MGQINSCKCKCIKGEIGQEICIEGNGNILHKIKVKRKIKI